MIVAAGGILLVALVNLCYGLPKMKFRKVLLLPYLVSESDYYSLIPAGRSYAAPRKDGDYAAKVDDVVQALNEGIENEDRTMRRTTSATLRRRITPYNAGHVDVRANLPCIVMLRLTLGNSWSRTKYCLSLI
jgi:hypothetical protein